MSTVELKRNIVRDYYYDEAIKTLRTNILFSGMNIKVILMTSSLPGEGKSDISFALAESLTQIGKKVIYLDADIRKSVLTVRYNVHGRINGLSQYLSGQTAMEDIIYHTDTQDLDMVFAGPSSPVPTDLFESSTFSEMIEMLRDAYDYIIVDTPPLGMVIDGAVIAKNCDAAVIVVESGAVSYKAVQSVKNQLDVAGCRILGVVLNKVDKAGKAYYGKYGKYGKFGHYKSVGSYGGTDVN